MGRKVVWPPTIIPHKPSGQARAKFNGKYEYLGPWGSAKAQERYLELLTLHAAGQPLRPPSPGGSVGALVVAFLDHAKSEYSERGREAQEFRLALAPLVRLFGSRPAGSIGTPDLQLYQSALASGSWLTAKEKALPARRGAVGCCRNVVNARVNRVRRAWRWAEEAGHLPKGCWANLCTVRSIAKTSKRVRHTADVKAVELADLVRVLRQIRHGPVRAILRVMWLTGARTGEACRMRGNEIDRSGPVWLYRPGQHKCDHLGQDRVIGLGARCQRVLARWLREADGRGDPGGYLFPPMRRGRAPHYGSRTLAQRVRPAALAAGGADFHSYKCRHAYKRRVSREMGLEASRAAMGHTSIATTASYSRATDLALVEAVAARLG